MPSSGDEFEDDRAGNENDESSSMSGMEADSEDNGHAKGSQKVNKGKSKAKSADKGHGGRAPGAVGKRKHASTGMGESEPT